MVSTTFDETLKRLGSTTGRSVNDLAEMYRRGQIGRRQLQSMTVGMLEVAGTQGAIYGQLAYAEYAAAMTGEAPPVIATAQQAVQHNQRTIAAKSIDTVMSGPDNELAGRLLQVGENLPVQAVQNSYAESLRADSRVEGWERGLEPDGCQLCVWWWRNGRVWPKVHPMPTHTGCRCQQIPTFVQGAVTDTIKSREIQQREAVEARRAMTIEERIQATREELQQEGVL